jgi:predicted alpha/beta-fold hydrolase
MIVKSGFKPAWWLRGAHAQTIWPGIMRRNHDIDLAWERLELPDNDFIDLVWTAKTDGPVVIVLHGLEGSINSHYAKGILSAFHRRGWRAVLMHFRGCSGTHNRLARGYHSGETGDLEYLINLLHRRFPQTRIAATGYSLGGNVLLKYLGEHRQNSGLTAAVAVSVPFVLSKAADRLMQGTSRIYQTYLLRRIQQRVINKFTDRQDAPFAINKIPEWNNFHLFDHYVTAPLHGFKSSEEYYRLSSSRQYLESIITPTLIIHAQNDPFLTLDAIPNEPELSDNVTLELTEDGGHAGFISGGMPWRPNYWLEERIPEFLSNHLS